MTSYVPSGVPGTENQIAILINDIIITEKRENAMAELSRMRESIPELGLLLWKTPGAVTGLLYEVISIYPSLFPPTLSSSASTRVCNALALMQCIAAHDESRNLFIKAQLPIYLYPFLNTASKARPFEFLRLTTLGVIGALVKNDNSEVIDYLLSTDIIPLCLKITETGNELPKTVSIFIIQKILIDNLGLSYICQTEQRLRSIIEQLNQMLSSQTDQPSLRLFKHIVRCYLRLTEDPKGMEELQKNIPTSLTSHSVIGMIKDDVITTKFYNELLQRLKISQDSK
jgi:CCR4-NOT transcription complex subunit 9